MPAADHNEIEKGLCQKSEEYIGPAEYEYIKRVRKGQTTREKKWGKEKGNELPRKIEALSERLSIQRERLNVPTSSHEAACVHYLVH